MSNFNEVLDIVPFAQDIGVDSTEVVTTVDERTTEDEDFAAVRTNYYEIIDQGKAAINTAMTVAAESQNPRALEVLSGLLKNMADINKQLISLSKDKIDIKAAKNPKNQTQPNIGTVQQAVFVGSGADLNKMLNKL